MQTIKQLWRGLTDEEVNEYIETHERRNEALDKILEYYLDRQTILQYNMTMAVKKRKHGAETLAETFGMTPCGLLRAVRRWEHASGHIVEREEIWEDHGTRSYLRMTDGAAKKFLAWMRGGSPWLNTREK
jgi:hypothetical protein